MGDIKGEAIGIEPFTVVDLGFAVDFKMEIVLTIVYLSYGGGTLEYSCPTYSETIFRRTFSFLE